MFTEEKPASPEEILETLEHFGVAGMRWGVHKTLASQEFYRKYPTAQARKAEILRARRSVYSSKKAYKSAPKDSAKREKLKKTYLRNPDRATALRLTRGEKIVTALLTFNPISAPIGLGAEVFVATRVGRRRKLEADLGRG